MKRKGGLLTSNGAWMGLDPVKVGVAGLADRGGSATFRGEDELPSSALAAMANGIKGRENRF